MCRCCRARNLIRYREICLQLQCYSSDKRRIICSIICSSTIRSFLPVTDHFQVHPKAISGDLLPNYIRVSTVRSTNAGHESEINENNRLFVHHVTVTQSCIDSLHLWIEHRSASSRADDDRHCYKSKKKPV